MSLTAITSEASPTITPALCRSDAVRRRQDVRADWNGQTLLCLPDGRVIGLGARELEGE